MTSCKKIILSQSETLAPLCRLAWVQRVSGNLSRVVRLSRLASLIMSSRVRPCGIAEMNIVPETLCVSLRKIDGKISPSPYTCINDG